MISRIKLFFDEKLSAIGQDNAVIQDDHQLHLASAALLFEVIRADLETSDSELDALKRILKEQYVIADHELEELAELAEQQSNASTSLYQFTRLINDHYDAAQKNSIICSMWKIAIADGNIDKYEENIIRRVAELLYIPHREFIKAKLDAGLNSISG
jgi:uncharacterized tellurite resistance protein B-like protein